MNRVNPDKNWFCIRTKVGLEARISVALSRLSSNIRGSVGEMEVYCPRIQTRRMVAGVSRPVVSALFPGYIFARFSPDTASRFVATRPGVIGFVKYGEQPAVVAEETIEELKAGNYDGTVCEDIAPFTPGQRLLIREGPFAGMEGEFVSKLGDGKRAVLLLEYLQRRVNCLADSAVLEPVA